jgi:hypothetical protein
VTSTIRDFDPAKGQAFQGDVAIIPMPADIAIARTDEIAPRDGRLILQEGEVTGHHHAIRLRHFRDERAVAADPVLATRSSRLRKAFRAGAAASALPSARMFRDPAAVQQLVARGILARTDLAVGCLVVEGGPMTVTHEEHDGIRLPPGSYYVGRQVESAGAEERRVAD